MLEPRAKAIVAWTLPYGDEVRDPDLYFERIDDEKPDAEMMPLIRKLISGRAGDRGACRQEDFESR